MANQTKIAAAMGPRDGDFIELRNAWAHVAITRTAVNDVGDYVYNLSGDSDEQFDTLKAAMDCAIEELGKYQRGRGD
jgi:hypothetical protein